MSGKIDSRLNELGITLPEPLTPVANYVPYVISGKQVIISGQVPKGFPESDSYIGQLGGNITVETGTEAARACALNILAQLKAACGGNLDRVKRCLRLGVFVNSTADFTQQPAVANGASNIMVDVFGDAGKHARAAVGSSQLPLGVAVEVDAMFEIE
ncbi:MAG: RidA family protein [Alphaproteobacteria bacterium]|nr:RidA family protein [Alphaproteobacteria bacterium]